MTFNEANKILDAIDNGTYLPVESDDAVEDELATQHAEADLDIFPTLEDRRLFLTTLKLMGIKFVTVEFSGGGDSGEISGISAQDAQGKEVNLDVDYPQGWERRSDWNSDTNKWIESVERKSRKLPEMLEALTYDALENCGHDWYNNDGGQGSLNIDFSTSPPTIDMNLEINFTSTDDYQYQL